MYRYGKEEVEAIRRVIESGHWLRYGEPGSGYRGEAHALEKEWGALTGSPHNTFTTSGTSALMMAWAGLGLGPGDEVLVPGYTWIATPAAPLHVGAIPVVVDVDESLTMDPAAVESAITSRTKAICPVAMNGLAPDMDRLLAICKQFKILMVEDACQAVGGMWKDRFLGTLGDAGAFSFNYYKVISCGEGGLFSCAKAEVMRRARIFHDCGVGFWDHPDDVGRHVFNGMNFRGNEILAAMMRVQFGRLGGIIRDLHRVRNGILDRIQNTSGLSPMPLRGGRDSGTGGYLGLRFEDSRGAQAFSEAFSRIEKRHGVSSMIPLRTGRHVYSSWEAMLEARGASNPDMDPYKHPANRMAPRLAKDSLPGTLDHLGRTVLFGANPDWTEEQVEDVSKAMIQARTTLASQPA